MNGRTIGVRLAIDAPIGRIRGALLDVTSWASWNPTIVRIRGAEAPLHVGQVIRVRQRGTPTGRWIVTDVADDGFAWTLHVFGLNVVADHRVHDDGGRPVAELMLAFDGPLAPVARWLTAGINERTMRAELEGLRAFMRA